MALVTSGDFAAVIGAVFGNPLVKAVLALLLANFVTGVAVAVKNGEFRLGAMMDWIAPAMYYLVGGLAISLVAMAVPIEYGGISAAVASTTWGGMCLSLVGKVLANVAELGVNVPVVLTDRPKAVTAGRP